MAQAILFLDRNRFDYYDGATNRVLPFAFAPNVVNALEVVSPTSLEAQIQAFIDQNTIAPGVLIIVISQSVLFEKDLTGLTPEQVEEQTQIFLDNVPFESLITKKTPFDNGVRISTTNKFLCDAIKSAFEKKGFVVAAVAPYESLGQDLYQITALDAQNAPVILRMFDTIKNSSFSVAEAALVKPPKTFEEKKAEKKAPPKSRTNILAGVFIVLLIILAVVFFTQKP